MKHKFKSVLCGALAFVAGSVVLSACGAKSNQKVETQSTITLTEAKEVITNALAIDGAENNRDFLEKMGKFDSKYGLYFDYFTNWEKTQSTSRYYENETGIYQNGKYVQSLITQADEDGEYSQYYFCQEDGVTVTYQYKVSDKSTQKVTYQDYHDSSIILDMFNEKMLDIYQNNVQKEIISDGYVLTLNADYNGVMKSNQVMGNYSDEEAQAYYDDIQSKVPEDVFKNQAIEMKITFDKNNQITAVKILYDAVSVNSTAGDYNIGHLSFEVAQYTSKITEPEWVTAYKASQN